MAVKCGAKTRSGGGCRKPAMPNGRCRLHGGLSTGPDHPNNATNAIKHGFYSDAIQPADLPLWFRVELGTVDDEIRLMRVKLHRLVKLSGSAEVADLIDSAFEIALKQGRDPTWEHIAGLKREVQIKTVRYGDLIVQALDQIRKLELARKELQKVDGKPPADPRQFTKLELTVIAGTAAVTATADGG